MRRRRRLAAGMLAVMVMATGCFDLGDDTDETASTPTTSGAPPVTTAAPLSSWPAGVVWGAFGDGTLDVDTPVEPGSLVGGSTDGPAGRVAVGRAVSSSGTLPGVTDLAVGRIWYREGDEWRPVDDTGLPNGTSGLYDVASWSGGYVAVGFHADGYERQATPVVLTSTDGRAWTLTSRLPNTWSAWGSRVRITSTGEVLVEVTVAICAVGSQFLNDAETVTVPALWAAIAPTGIYNELPSSALTALSPTTPTPSDGVGCLTDYLPLPQDERQEAYGRRLGSLAAVGERLVVLDPASTTVSITDDLGTWTSTRLPGAEPSPLGSLLYGDADGRVNVVTIRNRPIGGAYVDRAVDPDSWIATAWTETDDGTLRQVPPWRPLYAENLTFWQLEQHDGIVRLVAFAPAAHPGEAPVVRVAESAPTAPQPPPTCTPRPLADCNFVTLTDAELAGADLAGIQLYGATIDGGTFANANLDHAQLTRITIDGASFAGAYLTTATLLGARVSGTDLHAASLAYADLSAATFTASDLSAAILAGARIDGATVDGGTTCPDGQPPTAGAAAIITAACRL